MRQREGGQETNQSTGRQSGEQTGCHQQKRERDEDLQNNYRMFLDAKF